MDGMTRLEFFKLVINQPTFIIIVFPIIHIDYAYQEVEFYYGKKVGKRCMHRRNIFHLPQYSYYFIYALKWWRIK